MIGTVQLSSWMGKLFRPMGPGYRLQIKARAAAQKREMTKKSVHKVTQKPQVYFGGKQKEKHISSPGEMYGLEVYSPELEHIEFFSGM